MKSENPSFDVLENILNQNPETVRAALATEYSARFGARPIVLFGAGPLGNIMLAAMEKADLRPVAFADNNIARQGKSIGGVLVLSPAEAAAQYGRDAVFVVTIYNPSQAISQLKDLGCENIVGAGVLWRAHLGAMGAHYSFDSADAIFEQIESVRKAFSLFADDASRREYSDQLRWRTTPGFVLPDSSPVEETYFPPEIPLRDDDVFVDCGAFDGDTLRMVLTRRRENFARFIGFEPDSNNYAQFQEFVESLPASQREKVICYNAATGVQNGVVRFHAMGNVGSGISDEGEIEMNCVRLDDALQNEAPTFIKMDIEGAEPDALEGARAIFEKHQPAAAICVYHATEHLWRIPLLLHEMCPDSKIYLRRYAEECWELVVYAVPSGR